MLLYATKKVIGIFRTMTQLLLVIRNFRPLDWHINHALSTLSTYVMYYNDGTGKLGNINLHFRK